jgi:hypothetical protein
MQTAGRCATAERGSEAPSLRVAERPEHIRLAILALIEPYRGDDTSGAN